ncbi:MAG: hypothetical protein Q8P67_17025 [archaeon]|nr:hypothetical protein [archaeon]
METMRWSSSASGRTPPPPLLFDQIVGEYRKELAGNNVERAKARGEQALQFARVKKEPVAEGVALELLSTLGVRFGMFEYALQWLPGACAKGQDRPKAKELLLHSLLATGRDKEAVTLWLKDGDLRGRLHGQVTVLLGLSRAFRRQGLELSVQSSLEALRQALEGVSGKERERDAAALHERVAVALEAANCCRELGMGEEAEEGYRKALGMALHGSCWFLLMEVYHEYAVLQQGKREHGEALELLAKACHVAEDLADDAAAARMQLAMAECVWASGDRPRALNYCRLALDLSTKAGDPGLKAEALSRLVEGHTALDNHKSALEYDQARLEFLEARRASSASCGSAQLVSNTEPIINAHIDIGNRHLLLAAPRRAFSSFQTALSLAKNTEFFSGISVAAHPAALCQLSYAFQLIQEMELSEKFASAGLNLVQDPESSSSLPSRSHIRLLNNMGLALADRGMTTEGEEMLAKATSLAQRIESVSLQAMTLISHGTTLVSRGALEQAAQKFSEAYDFCYRHPRLSYSSHTQRCLGHQGLLALNTSNPEQARRFFADQMRLATRSRDSWGLSFALRNQGLMAIHDRDFPKALELLQRFVQHCLSIEQLSSAIHALELCADVHSWMGLPPAHSSEFITLAKALRTSRTKDPLLTLQP